MLVRYDSIIYTYTEIRAKRLCKIFNSGTYYVDIITYDLSIIPLPTVTTSLIEHM